MSKQIFANLPFICYGPGDFPSYRGPPSSTILNSNSEGMVDKVGLDCMIPGTRGALGNISSLWHYFLFYFYILG